MSLAAPPPPPDGAAIERELRARRKGAGRRGGPSAAALATRLWWDILRHLPQHMTASAIVAAHGVQITELTGIRASSKQRALIAKARLGHGLHLRIAGAGGWGGEAAAAMAKAAEAAEAEAIRHRAAATEAGHKAQTPAAKREGARVRRLRDAIVLQAAAGSTAGQRLQATNAALTAAGFPSISERTLRRIVKPGAARQLT